MKCEVAEGLKSQGQHKREEWGGGTKVLLTWKGVGSDEIGGLEIRSEAEEGAEQV